MLYIIRDFTAESLFFDSFTDVEQYSIMNIYMAKKKIINTKKKNAIKRMKAIEKSMLLTWDSLQSHLPYTYLKSSEGTEFHKQCVSDYIQLLVELNKILKSFSHGIK